MPPVPSSQRLSVYFSTHVTAAIATIRPGYAKRPPPRTQSDGYARETELSKLIRYGCMFELEVNQMEELRVMRAENRQLRRDLEKRSEELLALFP
jgi:hypothetical protein